MYKHIIIALVATLFFSCCNNTATQTADYNIIPLPQQIELGGGDNFQLNKSTLILCDKGNSHHRGIAEIFAQNILNITGYKLKVDEDYKPRANSILLKTIKSNDHPEGYTIDITENNITISGDRAGLFYGLQTLYKSIPANASGAIEFPAARINDFPAYPHRGAMLDVSRHFSSVEFVKKYIDMLAMHNMNVFHWHLTDDQGWRIEIKKYPKLTEIGSTRNATIVGRHSDTYTEVEHGGFYTQEEIKDIVRYASDRQITIIPEIDLPGHMLAALSSYPQLGCTGGPYKVGQEWGIYEDVLCAGNEDAFAFLDGVFSEVVDLFPSTYIHIGGDECLKNRWMACPKCQNRIKSLGLKADKEHTIGEQLQSYFIARIGKMLNGKGKKIIGWDEILEGGIAENATIMSWRGTEGGIEAAKKNHDVIMTPESHVYLDYYQSSDVDNEPFTFGWLTDLRKVYSFDPMPSELTAEQQSHIKGAQVNLWTEYMPTSDNIEYMLLPRLSALAETVWTNPKEKDYTNFVSRLYPMSKHFDRMNYKNCKQASEVQDSIEVDTVNNKLRVHLSTFDNSPIYYTTDGNVPNEKSSIYTNPIDIEKDITLKAIVLRQGVESKIYSKAFHHNLATAKPISIKQRTDPRYTFKGATTLVDGQRGVTSSYRTGSWIGFLGTDIEIIIDLEKTTEISSVSFNYFVNTKGGLFPPKEVTIDIWDDNRDKSSTLLDHALLATTSSHQLPQVMTFPTTSEIAVGSRLLKMNARYVKIRIRTEKTLPDWHEKKGNKAYFMIDEISIN